MSANKTENDHNISLPMPYKLRVPDEIASLIRGMHPLLKKRVKAALEEICNDPRCGKALKEELAGLKSFRIKRFRIIYKVSSKKEIIIVALGPRKYIYEETFKVVKKSQKP
jgi:mRNA interferase RelE/StbE